MYIYTKLVDNFDFISFFIKLQIFVETSKEGNLFTKNTTKSVKHSAVV